MDNYILTYLKWTVVFEWCVVRLGFKNKHPKKHVSRKYLCPHTLLTTSEFKNQHGHLRRKNTFTSLKEISYELQNL